MSQFNNAAGRLSDVLDFISKNAKANIIAAECIAIALGIKDFASKGNEISELFVLLSTLEKDLKNLKNAESLDEYLDVVVKFHNYLLQYGIYQNSSQPIADFIKQGHLALLFKSCASYIANEQLEHDLTEEQVKDFTEQARTLLQEITDSDLQPDIKTYLIARLQEVCLALHDYSIGGSKYLSLVVDASIGGLLSRQSDISLDRDKPTWQKVTGLLFKLSGLISFGSNLQKFVLPKIEQAVNLLLPPGE